MINIMSKDCQVKQNSHIATFLHYSKMVKAAEGCPIEVWSCGLVLDTNHRYLGATPDGMVFDTMGDPQLGLLEINQGPLFSLPKVLVRRQGQRVLPGHQPRWCPVVGPQSLILVANTGPDGYFLSDMVRFFCLERVEVDLNFWLTTMLPKLVFSHLVENTVLEGCWPSCCAITSTR